MIGVSAGDGMGVGSSRIGERHLLILLGISSKIVGGFRRLVLLLVVVLCAFSGSRTGTSIDVLGKWNEIGESGAQLVKLTGVCIDEVDESSSQGSCGLDADGVVDGEIISWDGI